ncbi:MAG: hypothetical protein V4649_16220 [Bacteroidota bacterium]
MQGLVYMQGFRIFMLCKRPMQTLTIKFNNPQTAKLIEDLANMNLLTIIKKSTVKPDKKKLSEKLAGSITKGQAAKMQKELTQMRNEWERD